MSFALSGAVDPKKVFITPKSDVGGRWDPNYYRYMGIFLKRMQACPFPIEKLKDSLTLVQYGSSERASEEPFGVRMLRMINLQQDSWDLSDLKYIEMTEAEKRSYLLEQGDLLFNRTNSKELVGKCNVFDLQDDYVFASYLIRVRLIQGKILPDYVAAYLSSSLGRIQINAVSRQIAGMTNINAEEIRDLLIPVPLMDVQCKVVEAWKGAIQKRDQTIAASRDLLLSIDGLLLTELGITPKHAPPNNIENRIFKCPFSEVTGARLNPLYHQGDIFSFVRAANCDLDRLENHVATFLSGFAAGRNDQGDEEDGIIQIRPTNISEDRELVFRRNVYIGPDELSKRQVDRLKRHEVLFNNTNSQEQVGKTAYFELEGDYFCSNHITRIATDGGRLDPQYLVYILNLYQRQKVFFKLCTNWNNQSGVGVDVLSKIPVPLPGLERQKQIVRRLDKIRIDAKELRRKAAVELEEAKKAIEAMILGAGDK